MSVYDNMSMQHSGTRATPKEFAIGFAVAGVVLGAMFGFVELSPLIFGMP